MQVFARVAQLGSFAAASRELRIPTSSVSRHVAQLEAQLETQLLHRDARHLRLTQSGEAYLPRCLEVLQALASAEEQLRAHAGALAGRLRISAGVSFTEARLGTFVADFAAVYPDIAVELVTADRQVDLVREGFDAAIRIGNMEDSALRARRLGRCTHLLCAAPAYLDAHPKLTHPSQLTDHSCILDTNQTRPWTFERDANTVRHKPCGRLRVNHAFVAAELAAKGHGFAYLPDFAVSCRLANGSLKAVLRGWRLREVEIFAVYPATQHSSPLLRIFLDALAASRTLAP